jgi:putative acetyltransferase
VTTDEAAIRLETIADHAAIAGVNARAFGAHDSVPALVAALRLADAPLPARSFVAEVGGEVVGHTMVTGCRLDAPRELVAVGCLSPLAVAPEFQRRGIGARLIAHALADADQRGVPLVFLEGDPRFYSTRGFAAATPLGFRKPSLRIPDAAFQVATLSSYRDWMTGTLVYLETFWAMDCVGLREPAA